MNKFLKSFSVMALSISTITSTFCFPVTTYASDNLATPNYEVKLMMDTSKILGSNGNLSSDAKTTFDISSSEHMKVQYLDTGALDLNNQGWIVRIRKFDSDDNTGITYKKRYSISNGDVTSALKTADNDGFDANENNYSAQVDWGYGTQTLSFSDNKIFSLDNYTGINLPNKKDSINEAIDNLPGKLNKYLYNGWAENELNNSILYGPYSGTRYIGTWNGLKVELEVYNINNDNYNYIAEISFKTDDYKEASSERQNLINTLSINNWLIKSDESKTGIMLGE